MPDKSNPVADVQHTPAEWIFTDLPGHGIEIKAKVNIGGDADHGGALQPIYRVPVRPSLSVKDDGTVWATIAYEDWRQFPSLDFKAMQRANGHLIASAPDLLAALDRIVSNGTPVDPDTVAVIVDDIEAARAAIRRARGGA